MPSKKKAPTTLYAIWSKAAKELTQIRGDYGHRKEKEACAFGAIAYYNPKKSGDLLADWDWDDMSTKTDLFSQQVGSHIIILNDKKHWTFEQFAAKAKELKL